MRPLEHVRILDLTHMLSGPYGTMLLADLGAETIKIEPPGTGEGTRRLLENHPKHSYKGVGAYILTLGRNKKSVALNLKSERGREIFYELVRHADAVVTNFAAGVNERLGISHDILSRINPRIITVSVTGFGETGPARNRPAFDQVVQGMGGGMSITGQPDGPPTRAGIPIGDLGGGVFAAIGLLSALVERERTGMGRHVDVSMLDCQISLLNYMATMTLLSGENPERIGNAHMVHIPYNTFKTATKYIIVAVIGDTFWPGFVKALDLTELEDEKYKVHANRFADRERIERIIQERLLTNTAEYWLERLREHRVPCGPVNEFTDALSDEQVLARNMVVPVVQKDGHPVYMPGNPVKFHPPMEESYQPAPEVGEHTAEVLGELLGLEGAALEDLKTEGVVG